MLTAVVVRRDSLHSFLTTLNLYKKLKLNITVVMAFNTYRGPL